MRKINWFGVTFATAMVMLLASCKSDNVGGYVVDMLPKTRAIELTASEQSLVAGSNEFSFNLVRKINEGRNGNNKGKSMFVSPLSVTYMLGMLNSGANEEGQKKITEVLGMSGSTALQVNEFCRSLMTQAPEVDKQVTLETANAIFTGKNFDLKPQFVKDVRAYYGADAVTVDFGALKALSTINGWVSDKTGGRISQILDSVDPSAAAYLLNTVFFEAAWTEKFDKNNTVAETFTSYDGTQSEVQMMHSKSAMLTGGNDVFTSVRLPYGSGDKWSMYVLLPNEGKTLDDVIGSLTADNWTGKKMQYASTVLDLSLPKFSVSDDIDMKGALSALGLGCIFDAGNGMLNNMCSRSDVSFYVDKMLQNSRIDVDEEGAKMTTVTVSEIGVTSPGMPIKDGNFAANRPFVYIVAESSSNAVFFVGTYTGK